MLERRHGLLRSLVASAVGATLLFGVSTAGSGCAADAPPVDTLPPPRKMRVQFNDYAIAGTHLFLHRDFGDAQCEDCEPRSYIEGEDLLGEPITTARLFEMAARPASSDPERRWLEAPDLARRAMDILLGRVGEPVLDEPGPDANCREAEDVCALIAPPKIDGDKLSFWIHEGATKPTLTLVEVDLNSGEVKRTHGADLAAVQ